MKCDEGKPVCNRCLSLGKSCKYDIHPFQDSDRETTFINAALQQPGYKVAPLGIDPSQRELQIFHMLHHETARTVAGSFNCEFWTRDVLQASQEYPAIWHASLALAAMHAEIWTKGETDAVRYIRHGYHVFALQQYDKAIKHALQLTIREQHSQCDKEALLLVSILFTALCCLQDEVDQAKAHVINILKLRDQWQFRELSRRPSSGTCNNILTIDSLLAVVSNFECQFQYKLTFVPRPPPPPVDIESTMFHAFSSIPFCAVTDAFFEIQIIRHRFLLTRRRSGEQADFSQPYPIRDAYYSIILELEAWNARFQPLQTRHGLSQTEREGLQLLWLYYLTFQMCLSIRFEVIEIGYDAYQPLFKKIVDTADKAYARQEMSEGKPIVVSSGFSFSPTFCELLLLVGVCCRDSVIRRRAINLLRDKPRRSGIWDSRLFALASECIMVIEENGHVDSHSGKHNCKCAPGVFICHDHRVAAPDISFVRPGEALMVINTIGGLKEKLPPRTITLSWRKS